MEFENFEENLFSERLLCSEMLDYISDHGKDIFQEVADIIKRQGKITDVIDLEDGHKFYEVRFHDVNYFIVQDICDMCQSITADLPSSVISNGRQKQSIDDAVFILYSVSERRNQSMQDRQNRL